MSLQLILSLASIALSLGNLAWLKLIERRGSAIGVTRLGDANAQSAFPARNFNVVPSSHVTVAIQRDEAGGFFVSGVTEGVVSRPQTLEGSPPSP